MGLQVIPGNPEFGSDKETCKIRYSVALVVVVPPPLR